MYIVDQVHYGCSYCFYHDSIKMWHEGIINKWALKLSRLYMNIRYYNFTQIMKLERKSSIWLSFYFGSKNYNLYLKGVKRLVVIIFSIDCVMNGILQKL